MTAPKMTAAAARAYAAAEQPETGRRSGRRRSPDRAADRAAARLKARISRLRREAATQAVYTTARRRLMRALRYAADSLKSITG